MMTNLFSIFDPSTPSFLSMNWLSCLLFSLLIPSTMWMNNSRYNFLASSMFHYIFSEFKPLVKTMPFMLILPLSFFVSILYNNVMGLLPYVFTATSHLSFTLSLALPCWITTLIFGWLNNTNNILAHLIPQGTPPLLMPFMVLIEMVSNIIRPGTLAIRLTANMIAGHLLIVLLSSSFLVLPFMSSPILLVSQVALSTLEIAVAFIQAYVFSVLITLYLSECST
uniref:ATP synthase F0 subunit 6 n=1 Tax=Charcotia amundseni TaxID=2259499 RepID=UPI001FF6AA09|nr:ATP synthase F0 subunit 6 [Charcotia amundseni]UIN24682.1 ATP synthase F0 subunit 6 [Charcotia amundseni]